MSDTYSEETDDGSGSSYFPFGFDSDYVEDRIYDDYDDDDDDDDENISEGSNKVNVREEEMNRLKRCSNLCSKLNTDRKDGVLCDTVILVGNQRFPVHKGILKSASSYFAAMFTGSFSEKDEQQIEIKGVTSETFATVLDYIYGEELKLTFENVKDIYIAGDMFCVDPLINECKSYVRNCWDSRKDMKDVQSVYEIAGIFEMTDITEKLLHYARIDLANIMGKTDYLELTYKFLLTVLEGRSSIWNLLNESTTASNILKWTLFKPEERLPEISSKVFSAIRFEFISEDDFEGLLQLIVFEGGSERVELLKQFKEHLQHVYKKSHQRLSDQSFMIVHPDTAQTEHIHVFNCETWKWELLTFQLPKSPEMYVLGGEDLYVFDMKGCTKANLQTRECLSLPPFPESRRRSVFSVMDKTVYVMGGVKEHTNKPMGDILDLKQNKRFWHRAVWNGIWKNARCKVSSITHEQNIYLVGGRNALNKPRCRSKCFVYNCESRKLKKICELSIPICQPNLAIHNGVLYVFSTDGYQIEGIDLKDEKLIPVPQMDMVYRYTILSVCSVDEGIVIAYSCDGKILFVLFKPNAEQYIEYLGLIQKPKSWQSERLFEDFKLLLYRKNK